jgi:hypothetical protein
MVVADPLRREPGETVLDVRQHLADGRQLVPKFARKVGELGAEAPLVVETPDWMVLI